MVDRPWESDDDRAKARQAKAQDSQMVGCLAVFFVGLFLLVLFVLLSLLGLF